MIEPILVTAYTPKYKSYADRFMAGMGAVGFHVRGVEYGLESTGWIGATLQKPMAIEEAWLRLGARKPIFGFDADIQVSPLATHDSIQTLLDLIVGAYPPPWQSPWQADAAFCFKPVRNTQQCTWASAGVFAFSSSPKGRAGFALWAQMCRLHPHSPDISFPEQHYLWDTIVEMRKWGCALAMIPLRFNAKPEELPKEEIVLLHVPASRETRS